MKKPLISSNNKDIGRYGEDIAARHLQRSGLKIVQRNYKTPLGEADIVAMDNDTTVFVEVKTRSGDLYGEPFEAVDEKKRERLSRIALYYQKQQGKEMPIRFDIVSVKLKGDEYKVNHIVDVFQ